jgi:hypothetical protein
MTIFTVYSYSSSMTIDETLLLVAIIRLIFTNQL